MVGRDKSDWLFSLKVTKASKQRMAMLLTCKSCIMNLSVVSEIGMKMVSKHYFGYVLYNRNPSSTGFPF